MVVVGMGAFPAIDISPVKQVTYGWLFLCANVEILGLGLRGACLGVPVLSTKMALAGGACWIYGGIVGVNIL